MLFNQREFPNLNAGNHRDIINTPDTKYNCISWAAGDTDKWWDPTISVDPNKKFYWPPNAPRDYKATSLVIAFESVGFLTCADGALEQGVEKIAIYSVGLFYEHAARQLDTGKWTSKMGEDERIEHDAPENLEGPLFGKVTAFMKPARAPKA